MHMKLNYLLGTTLICIVISESILAQHTIEVLDVRRNVLNLSPGTIEIASTLGVVNPGEFGTWYASYWHNFQDWNQDQKDDLILMLAGKENEILIGLFTQGDNLQFNEVHDYLMYVDGGQNDFSTTVGDMNRDGLLDVYMPGYWNEDPLKNNPSTLFINNGNGFNNFYVDTTLFDLDLQAIQEGAETREKSTGVLLDLDLDGHLDLHFPQGCWQYNRGHLLRKYEYQPGEKMSIEYLPLLPSGINENECWDTTYDYVKVIGDTLYSALWRNIENSGKEVADYKICKWNLPISEENKSVNQCIDIERDPTLYAQRDIGDNFSFWVTDLNKDGVLEYVFLMFTPYPDNYSSTPNNGSFYHSSIHVFDADGKEMTSNWFQGDQYVEKNGAAANGIYVVDMNSDGYPDILPISGFYSPVSGIYLYLNNGSSFIQTTIVYPSSVRGERFIQNQQEYGFRIPVDLTGDHTYEILHLKMDSFQEANANIVFLDYESSPVSVTPNTELPSNFQLEQNYPNPFNPITQIKFSLPKNTQVKLEVFTILGQSVSVLVDGNLSGGVHSVVFDGSGVTSGVYLYKLTTPEFTQTRVMNLLK